MSAAGPAFPGGGRPGPTPPRRTLRSRGAARSAPIRVAGPARLAALVTALLALVACEDAGPPPGLTLERALAADWSGLEVEVVTSMPEGRRGGTAIVLLHGYGQTGADYADLAHELAGDEARVFLPTAVLPHPEGAMWWEFFEDDWPKPYSDDPSANAWPRPSRQLPPARRAVVDLVARVRRQYAPEAVALVGHSQGGMLALDAAVAAEPPVERVAVLSGYVLLDSVPQLTAPREERPAVFVSHGRDDALVGFEAAERMRRLLERSGYEVTFAPHAGGHEVADAVVPELRAFLLKDERPR